MACSPEQWTGPLSKDVDLCQHFYEDGGEALEPTQADGSLPVRRVEDLPLVFDAPYFVQAGREVFKITEEGSYRFGVFPDQVYQRIVFRKNLPRFVGAIGQLHIHGWRENKKPVDDLLEIAKSRFVSVTCGVIREVAMTLMAQAGIQTRRISTFTLDQWNSYNCGHALYEYFDPIEGRWILADSDAGAMFQAQGRWLDADAVCRLNRAGKPWRIMPVATGFNLDLCAEHVEKQIGFYAMMMSGWVHPALGRQFFDRIFHVPMIDNCYSVDTPAQKARFEALCQTVNLNYRYLPPAEFRQIFYADYDLR